MDKYGEEAWVRCSVATIWKEPKIDRPIDRFATSNSPSIEDWIKEMSIEEKLWLVGRIETQALYGTMILILEQKEDWIKVCVPSQTTFRNPLGYEGWMLECQLLRKKKKYEVSTSVRIKEKIGIVYEDVACLKKWGKYSFLTTFPFISVQENKVKVLSLEGDEKWISLNDVDIVEKKPITDHRWTGALIAETAHKFIGVPYLWGGTSSFGYDCSGFVYSLFHGLGIQIPRDASEQVSVGEEIPTCGIQEGDVLYFARENGKGRVHHVGLYKGEGEMIHAPNSRSSIQIEKIAGSNYEDEWAHTRRFNV
jgi:hypothetical protein